MWSVQTSSMSFVWIWILSWNPTHSTLTYGMNKFKNMKGNPVKEEERAHLAQRSITISVESAELGMGGQQNWKEWLWLHNLWYLGLWKPLGLRGFTGEFCQNFNLFSSHISHISSSPKVTLLFLSSFTVSSLTFYCFYSLCWFLKVSHHHHSTSQYFHHHSGVY